MTPVARLVAIPATSADSTLLTALTRPSAALSPDTAPVVHSVHRRVVNVRVGDQLVALASNELDNAPGTIRVPVGDWNALRIAPGQAVILGDGQIQIRAEHTVTVLARSAIPWTAPTHELGSVALQTLSAAAHRIEIEPTPAVETAFGRAIAPLLATRTATLGDALRRQDAAGITVAATGLLGLGEGLTPSGDDILTGVAFLAAQPGMRLYDAKAALAVAVRQGTAATTLLSLVTIGHALAGRGRQSLHDLAHALEQANDAALAAAVTRIAAIGHTSGADTLAGVRLALQAEMSLRSTKTSEISTNTKEFTA